MAARTAGGGVIYPTGDLAKPDDLQDGSDVLSTTDAGKQMMAATYVMEGQDKLAQKVLLDSKWRVNYGDHIAMNVFEMARSEHRALTMAQAGIDHMLTHYRFERGDTTRSLKEGFAAARASPVCRFTTVVIDGDLRGDPEPPDAVGFMHEGEWLHGAGMLRQLDQWCAKGSMETSVAASVRKVLAAGPKWTDLSDEYFVVMGAGGAMCPTECLLRLGANVIAVDIPRPTVYKRLIELGRNSRGRLLIPVRTSTGTGTGAEEEGDTPQGTPQSDEAIAEVAGVDLIAEGPELTNWLTTLAPGKPLNVGSYAYADGALFVRVVLAMDQVLMGLCHDRPDTSWSYLCSPTDCFKAPVDAKVQSDGLRGGVFTSGLVQSSLLTQPMNLISSNTFFVENGFTGVDDGGTKFFVAPEFVNEQGPNYALAKRIQHWRAMLLRGAGHTVSANIAPASKTVSVMKQTRLATAYAGTEYFHPITVYEPAISNTLMGYLMLHDINCPDAFANPNTKLNNPLDIFIENACHNGFWRSGFCLKSLIVPAAVIGMAEPYLPAVKITAAVAALLAFKKASRL